MTREEFKKQIELPLKHYVYFEESIDIKAIILRTLRLALQCPNLAQEYLDSLPKLTMK